MPPSNTMVRVSPPPTTTTTTITTTTGNNAMRPQNLTFPGDMLVSANITVPALRELLAKRCLPTDGLKATLMARLQMSYLGWEAGDESLVSPYFTTGITKGSLQHECIRAGVSGVGTVPELRLRLVAAAMEKAEYGEGGEGGAIAETTEVLQEDGFVHPQPPVMVMSAHHLPENLAQMNIDSNNDNNCNNKSNCNYNSNCDYNNNSSSSSNNCNDNNINKKAKKAGDEKEKSMKQTKDKNQQVTFSFTSAEDVQVQIGEIVEHLVAVLDEARRMMHDDPVKMAAIKAVTSSYLRVVQMNL